MAKSRLEQVLDAVQARVLASVPGCAFEFGEPHAAQHARPPRIAFFRAKDGTTTGPARTTARNERVALLDRATAVVAVCWAVKGGAYETDDAAIEALVDALELALREELGSALMTPLVEGWTVEGWSQMGKSAQVLFTVRQPVCLPAPAVLDPSDDPADVGFDNSDSDETDGILTATEP